MLTRVSPPPASSARKTPRPVRSSSAAAPVSAIRTRATQRVALPQASAGEPSALQKSTSAAAPAPSRITASWSNPTPRLRSPSARASAGVTGGAADAGVDHHEVVAEPVHLEEPEIAGLTRGERFAIHARYIGEGAGAATGRAAGRFALDRRRRPAYLPRQLRARSSVVEQLTLNQLVEGSNPSGLTKHPRHRARSSVVEQ